MSQTYEGTLEIVECASCHMNFGVTPAFMLERRRDHKTFHCPARHNNYYPDKSDLQKQRDKTAAANRQKEALEREKEALPSDVREATGRAQSYRFARAQRGAFWRGFEDRNCGVCVDACPYSENDRGGFRRAWFDGYDAEDPSWVPVVIEAEETR